MALPRFAGIFVHYRLTQADVDFINNRRSPRPTIAQRIAGLLSPAPPQPPSQFQGSSVIVGAIYPMVVTAIRPLDSSVNGQVFLDGNDNLWAFNVREGTDPGFWTTLPA